MYIYHFTCVQVYLQGKYTEVGLLRRPLSFLFLNQAHYFTVSEIIYFAIQTFKDQRNGNFRVEF